MLICFGTYNIRNGHNVELESVLRGMGKSNVDVGVFQDTKLTEGIYMRRSARYKVVTTPAPSQHHGGVALFYWNSPAFAVEAIRQLGANIIACQLETRGRLWYTVGYYLAPGDRTTIRDVEAAMVEQKRVTDFIVEVELNMDLEKAGVQ